MISRRHYRTSHLCQTSRIVYIVLPASEGARLEYRGLPLDWIEDMLIKSPAWLQARRVTHAEQVAFSGRPLTPLHAGHVALCAVSGLLNGCSAKARIGI